MGALASLDQRDEVRKADRRRCAASAEIVYGDPDRVDVVDADAERGAFLSPRAAARAPDGATEPHDVEPFGPVSTVLTYDDLDEAVELAARGSGSLVGSVVTHDPDVARIVVLGLAPWHGRILVLDRDDAEESHRPRIAAAGARARRTRPRRRRRGARRHPRRAPPHAAHRDPGLARHAHGDHRPLDDGSQRGPSTDVHPFRKSLAELRIGDTIASASRARSRWPTSTTSPSSPATRSTPTPTRRRRAGTRCSAASSPTATSSSRWPPVSSSTPTPARCWPTSASTTCGS